MSKKKDTDVQNIKAAGITKSCSIGGRTVNFRLQNVFTGEVNGKEELLDEILVDNMQNRWQKRSRAIAPDTIPYQMKSLSEMRAAGIYLIMISRGNRSQRGKS